MENETSLYNMFRKNIIRFGGFSNELSIDEIMVKYFSIRQCILNKPIRFGIKIWVICSCEGFIFDLEIYTGKDDKDNLTLLQNISLDSRVVMKMLERLLSSTSTVNLSNFDIYFDNFFTSPDLLIHLKKKLA